MRCSDLDADEVGIACGGGFQGRDDQINFLCALTPAERAVRGFYSYHAFYYI